VFLQLYGSGMRHAIKVTTTISGALVQVPYAAQQGTYPGQMQLPGAAPGFTTPGQLYVDYKL
jgi:hypothetical protein